MPPYSRDADPLHLREHENESEPLRMNDLMDLLNDSGRYTKCPHCDHKGAWEISTTSEERENPGDNPRLTMYRNYAGSEADHYHTTAAMTCPNCGHFAQISTYKIRQHKNQGRPNG